MTLEQNGPDEQKAEAELREVVIELRESINTVLEIIQEHDFEDSGCYHYCRSCGWNTKDDWKPSEAFSHHEGCKLKKALTFLSTF